jgi:hypothetical protein
MKMIYRIAIIHEGNNRIMDNKAGRTKRKKATQLRIAFNRIHCTELGPVRTFLTKNLLDIQMISF